MKKKFLRLLIVLTISITALLALGMTAFADTAGDFTVTATNGGELTAEDYTYADGVLTIISDTPIAISGTTTADRIEVADGVSANITLAGVDIDVSSQFETAAFMIADNSTGDVKITLSNDTTNTLKSGYRCAGLQKNGGVNSGKLTIGGTGILNATGGEMGGAGIGGDGMDGAGSNIAINGGTVTATGGEMGGAGIGGGANGTGSNITISGGFVKAVSENGNPIGGGSSQSAVIPTNGTENVYLLVVENPNGEDVYIDDVLQSVKNHPDDTSLYVYLTGSDHTVKVGDTITEYGFDVTFYDKSITPELTISGEGVTEGVDYTYSKGTRTFTILSDKPITISGSTTIDTIVIADGVSANITLAGVNIDVSATENACAFKIADNSTGDVKITLSNDTTNTLKSGFWCAGLQKNGGVNSGTLTIGGTGILNATGGHNGAGIGGGGGENTDCANIVINSGTINATATHLASGIGGANGNGCSAYNIEINGGNITARGADYGTGIGACMQGNADTITITGGVITSSGGWGGAGIGSNGGSVSNISISGGTVTATGGGQSAGIGGGYGGNISDITINGGVVLATAGYGVSNSIGAGGDSGGGAADLSGTQDAIIIDGTAGTATVYGDPVITDDFTLPEGYTLVIPEGSTVTVAKGATFTNNGTVTNNGRFTCRGAFVNGENAILENNLLFTSFGDFENNGTIANNNDLNNSGAFTNNGNITNTSASIFSNEIKGVITNNSTGTITNESGATIENKNFTGSAGIVNNGTIDNSGSISNGANSYGGSVIENNGDITNSGEIINMADCEISNSSVGTITNESSGTIENNGTIENSGDFVNNGTTEGDGEISGNQPYAEAGDFVITGGNYGTDYNYANGVLIIKTATSITIANKTPENATTDRIEVATGVSADITLNGVNIDVSGTENACAFKIADNSIGNVTITLADGTTNTLKSGKYCAGLQKNGEYSDALGTLIIYGGDLGTGSLTATGGTYGAGIGGGDGGDGSNITINGGTVTVTGGYSGAGIGGGEEGAGT